MGGSYWPYCSGVCSKAPETDFKCRTVELVTKNISDLYRSAIDDASKAHELEKTNEKAHYRQARANVCIRDFPRAVLCILERLKHCPDSVHLKSLLEKIMKIAGGRALEHFSNPMADLREVHDAGQRALRNGAAMIMCAFCTAIIAHKRPKFNIDERVMAGLGKAMPCSYKPCRKKAKENALRAAGFPDRCPFCACNPCADIDQKAIRELIDSA